MPIKNLDESIDSTTLQTFAKNSGSNGDSLSEPKKIEWPDKEEWLKAREQLSNSNIGEKLKRSTTGLSHSFIVLTNKLNEKKIFCIGYKKFLGAGQFGRVKLAMDEKGNTFAIKIGKAGRVTSPLEIEILKQLDQFEGHATRIGSNKEYLLLPLHQGKELSKYCSYTDEVKPEEKISISQMITAAISAASEIQILHDKGILHRDIKAQNFLLFLIDGKTPKATIIDFGESAKLPDKDSIVNHDRIRGTEGFIAPEIFSKLGYSQKTDIYALGMMFKNQMKLVDPLFDKMTNPDPNQRPNINEVVDYLKTNKKRIELMQALVSPIIQALNKYKSHLQRTKMSRFHLFPIHHSEKTVQAVQTLIDMMIKSEDPEVAKNLCGKFFNEYKGGDRAHSFKTILSKTLFTNDYDTGENNTEKLKNYYRK